MNQSTNDQQVSKRSMLNEMLFSLTKKSFAKLDIEINGDRPWDIQVHNEALYFRLFKFFIGIDRMAVGEAYMDGQFDCEDLVAFVEKGLRSKDAYNKTSLVVSNIWHSLPLLWFNMQSKLRSKQDISSHYDIGNDLFKMMLDKSMNYSCGYWQKNVTLQHADDNNNNAQGQKAIANTLCETIDEAQMNKMFLIARKLHLQPGMKVLDIGSGWGYLAKFLAINFDVHVVGITISKEQYHYATTTDTQLDQLDFLRVPGLQTNGTGKFEYRLQDYRDVVEVYDRIVSVGMIEHVGKSNYAEFFEIARRCLTTDGLFLLHTIGIFYHKIPQVDPWANKYIFPGGMIPYHTQLIDAFYGKFIIEDWHNLGYDYYRTLLAWHHNFLDSWPKLEMNYSARFKRMWTFYLLSSAACFKTRKISLWQIVLSRSGFRNANGGYVSYR